MKATVTALVVCGALGLAACGGDEESTSATVASATSTTASEASTTTEAAPHAGVPSGLSDPKPKVKSQEGSARSTLPERVAGLTLVEVADAPALIKGGALDAVVAIYAHYEIPYPGDVANPKRFHAQELRHELAVFPSPADAESWRQRVVKYVTKDAADAGYQINGEQPLTDQDGTQIGTATSLSSGPDRTILWTNGTLYGAVDGFGQNGELVLGFYSELPY